ncbi:hypothetical protein [Saccharothrix sp. HUAS TT1]|uniref:hypothetical protein n=1 Tax=unclassified Saccharothrix TaxID=2593673 RepID=UPI00345B6AA4
MRLDHLDDTTPPASAKEPSDVVSEVLSSWGRTARLCLILLMAAPAVAGAVGVLLVLRG